MEQWRNCAIDPVDRMQAKGAHVFKTCADELAALLDGTAPVSPPGQEPIGTSICPICGDATPHGHLPHEVIAVEKRIQQLEERARQDALYIDWLRTPEGASREAFATQLALQSKRLEAGGIAPASPLQEEPALLRYMSGTVTGPERDAAFLETYAARVLDGTAATWEIPSTVAGTLQAIASRLKAAPASPLQEKVDEPLGMATSPPSRRSGPAAPATPDYRALLQALVEKAVNTLDGYWEGDTLHTALEPELTAAKWTIGLDTKE